MSLGASVTMPLGSADRDPTITPARMQPMQTQTPKTPHQHADRFRRGIEQFNSGRFFDAHETWEEIWLSSQEPEKTFLQGIIQIAAAFHHYSRGNLLGTRSLLEAALGRLTSFPQAHNGIALEPLRLAARQWAASLAAQHDPGADRVPQIHLV